jgi:hypothetical protein
VSLQTERVLNELTSIERVRYLELIRVYGFLMEFREPINITTRIENLPGENLEEIKSCSICWDDKCLKKFVKFDCNHEFCNDCVTNTIRARESGILCCALCRAETHNIKTRSREINNKITRALNT